MRSERPPVQRIYGSEIEYSYTFFREGGNVEFPLINFKVPKYTTEVNNFLENGARSYVDRAYPEYATAECKSTDEIVLAELIGEKIIVDSYREHPEITSFHKRSSTPSLKYTSGAHENYMTPLSISHGNDFGGNLQSLMGFNATRTIFIGSGQPSRGDRYNLSQKISDIEDNYGTNSTKNKPLVHIRNEMHGGGADITRLHIICGDHNISPWVIKMKFGTYSLMLRLLEHGVAMKDLYLKDPLSAAWNIDANIQGLSTPIELANNRTITPIDYQREIADRSAALGEEIEIPQDERVVLENWFTILDSLDRFSESGELQPEMRKLDWATKYELIQAKKEKLKPKSLSAEDEYRSLRTVDIVYHMLPDPEIPNSSLIPKLRKGRFAEDTPSEEEIEKWKTIPFPGTRAQIRGEFIRELRHHLSDEQNRVNATWEGVVYHGHAKVLPATNRYSREEVRKFLYTVYEHNLKGDFAQSGDLDAA